MDSPLEGINQQLVQIFSIEHCATKKKQSHN